MKADGYGLGAAEVGRALAAAGCRTFFTATPSEASALRAAIGGGPTVYILNGAAEGLDEIAAAGADPVLNTLDEVTAADAAGRARGAPLRAALQIETGMNRLGADVEAIAAAAQAGLPGLEITLILSHLACSDTPEHPQNAAQKQRFDTALTRLRSLFPDARASLAATGGALLGADYAYDLVRPGVGLFGGSPFADARPVVRLEAPIMRVFEAAAGETSGYGGTWRAERPSVLATIPVGYADGLPRLLSGRGVARIGDDEAPYAGRVSMDLIVLDVTQVSPRPKVGERAALIDEVVTVDRIATAAETIGYEILTRLGPRYRRVYRTERSEE